MKNKIYIAIISIFLISFTSTLAQGSMGEVGKLFKKNEANILFGGVKNSVQIDSKLLKLAILKAKDYVLFTVKNGKIHITDEKKKSLTENNVALDLLDQSYIFSKSKVVEFLNLVGDSPIYIEQRQSTLTLTAGETTLEFSTLCPPVCFE